MSQHHEGKCIFYTTLTPGNPEYKQQYVHAIVRDLITSLHMYSS